MKLMSRIRALFTLRGKQTELDLVSAEVRQNGVYLHPKDDTTHTYFVKTDEVDIIIKPGAEITEEDIYIRSNTVHADPEEPVHEIDAAEDLHHEPETVYENVPGEEPISEEGEAPKKRTIRPPENEYVVGGGWSKPKKKSFTVMLYPDEYDKLTQFIKENGYKKVEYILACVESVKKTSMEANYKRFTEDHERRRKEDAKEAKRVREEEAKKQQAESEQPIA